MKRIKIYAALIILAALLFIPRVVHAQASQVGGSESTVEAQVVKILEEMQIVPVGAKSAQLYQKLQMVVTTGKEKGKTIVVENGNLPIASVQKYVVGDQLVLLDDKDPSGAESYTISDYVRRVALLWLFVLFVFVAVVVGRMRGFMALIGMAISFMIIFLYILPQFARGADPMTVAVIGSVLIVPITFYLSHGFNKKTTVAIVGTLIALVITGVLAQWFVGLAKLSGYGSEEAGFLQSYNPGLVNIPGLLLASIVIGGIGVLNDITVSQSAVVSELRAASEKLSFLELYKKAMNVGHDHIASMINTLVLVYAGASLPLLLLFINNPQPFSQIINYEFMAEEVVRTLVASIGLILAVPITTLLAAFMQTVSRQKSAPSQQP